MKKKTPTKEDKAKIWNMPTPDREYLISVEKPTTRKKWAQDIYDIIFCINMATGNFEEKELETLQEVKAYCETYGMLSIAWFAERLRRCLQDKVCAEFDKWDSSTEQWDALRGVFHDETVYPITLHDSDYTRERIHQSFLKHHKGSKGKYA